MAESASKKDTSAPVDLKQGQEVGLDRVKPEEVAPLVDQEKIMFSWKAPTRPYRASGKRQMAVPTVIAVLLGMILLLAGEWMLVALVVAIAFAYYAWTTVPPEEAEYALTTRGVRMHGQLFDWGMFTRWWMTEKWGHRLVALEAPENMAGRILLPLGGVDEEKIEKIVNKYVLKEKPEETSLDRMAKWMGEKFPLEEKL